MHCRGAAKTGGAMVSLGALLISLSILTPASMAGAALVRQPYLQMGTPTSMIVAWRTSSANDSRVRYGTVPGVLDQSASDPSLVTDHFVSVSGLTPGTKYYYDVGSSSAVEGGGTSEHYFVSSPVPGSQPAFSVWIVGDSGTGGGAQANVRDAMLAVTAGHPPDLFLHVGDMAYNTGTDLQFTNNFFAPYADILRHTVVWPGIGNHEALSSDSTGQTGPYYQSYVLPTAGQAGGVASGTEAYYSFDYANVHFIVLDSADSPLSVPTNPASCPAGQGGAMYQWLCLDLAATTQDWIIAYWHHPPYTKGSHDSDLASDSGGRLVAMREGFVPVLEAWGVDLLLAGHSHIYERSYLIDGVHGYGTSPHYVTPGFATLQADGHILDAGDGRPAGDGAYAKQAGLQANEGAVYVVAGHGGAGVSGSANHPVMRFSELANGSCVLQVSANTLTFQNIRSDQTISDEFTLAKAGATVPAGTTVGPPLLALLLMASSGVLLARGRRRGA